MALRPFIVEALVPRPAGVESSGDVEDLYFSCLEELGAWVPWLVPGTKMIAEIVAGSHEEVCDGVRLRLLVRARRSLTEEATRDGELLVIRVAHGEIIWAGLDVYHVTPTEITRVEGSFACDQLTCRDDVEVGEDLNFFLMPDVYAAVEQRVEALVGVPDFAIGHFEEIDDVTAGLLRGTNLSDLSHEDVDDLAMRVLERLERLVHKKGGAR
jgi:hypothetical protein